MYKLTYPYSYLLFGSALINSRITSVLVLSVFSVKAWRIKSSWFGILIFSCLITLALVVIFFNNSCNLHFSIPI
jgi:hypothetical protein